MGGNADMHRFLITPDSIKNGRVTFTGDDAKHMLQVLRHIPGDIVYAFDGTGTQYKVELDCVEKGRASGEIISEYNPGTEPEKKVILYQGVPKTDKMDWVVQKSVELGVWRIVPMITQHSVVQLRDKNTDSRLERWNRISREACKQSGRVVVPEVTKPVEYKDALDQWKHLSGQKPYNSCFAVFCHEKEEKNSLKDIFKCYNINCTDTIGIFTGPEGGFSCEEVNLASETGLKAVSLGKRILRTETAAIAVISVIMHEMGELGL